MSVMEKMNEMNWVPAPEPIVYEPTAPPLAEIIECECECECIPYAEVVEQRELYEAEIVEYCETME
jgi:hypothetical protein